MTLPYGKGDCILRFMTCQWWSCRSRFDTSLVVCVLGALGCGSAVKASASQLVNEARSNEVQATAKYRDESIEVSGVIAHMGIRNVDRTSIEHEDSLFMGQASLFGSNEAQSTVRTHRSRHPYVYLEPPGQRGGDRILAYFGSGQLDDIAALRPGDRQTIVCEFQEIAHQGPRIAVVLTDCSLKD